MSISDRHVPDLRSVPSDYRIGAHYFPGRKHGDHWGWSKIAPFPERKALQENLFCKNAVAGMRWDFGRYFG